MPVCVHLCARLSSRIPELGSMLWLAFALGVAKTGAVLLMVLVAHLMVRHFIT